jgi:hypothetical protein
VPHRLNAFLNSNKELIQLTNKAQQLKAVQHLLEQVIPPSLMRGCHVMQFDQNILTLSAENGAIASKLRQMTTELASKLHHIGCEVTLIQVVVQVNTSPYSPPAEKRSISLSGKTRLTEFAESLHDSPLKDALKRLAKQKDPT